MPELTTIANRCAWPRADVTGLASTTGKAWPADRSVQSLEIRILRLLDALSQRPLHVFANWGRATTAEQSFSAILQQMGARFAPFVALGMLRSLYLICAHPETESATREVLRNGTFAFVMLSWVGLAMWIVYQLSPGM